MTLSQDVTVRSGKGSETLESRARGSLPSWLRFTLLLLTARWPELPPGPRVTTTKGADGAEGEAPGCGNRESLVPEAYSKQIFRTVYKDVGQFYPVLTRAENEDRIR